VKELAEVPNDMVLRDVTDFVAYIDADVSAVPLKFFNVTGVDYLITDSIQAGLDVG